MCRLFLLALFGLALASWAHAQVDQRLPWTTSRVVGTPEPPLPYSGQRVFPKLQWRQPLEVTHGLGRLFVVERWGRISSFEPASDAATFDTLIEMRSRKGKPAEATFGFALHPEVRQNRLVYICYATVKRGEDATHVSQFKLKSLDPPVADPDSEKILLKFDAGPHNGACLRFGPDGMLYISTGDAMPASPPDGKKTGQDISDLESSILRIDVRPDPKSGKRYRIPPDNPFVKIEGARPEVYAFGMRQPWKMAFEPGSNVLWVGDVGWNRWEMVHRVTPGYNGGWSVAEGPEVIRPGDKRGPAPITHALYSYSHSDGASITGGYVYRGKRLAKLKGAYIFGDHENGMIRAIRIDASGKLLGKEDLAQTSVGVATFGEAENGDLYFANFRSGKMLRLRHNPAFAAAQGKHSTFPKTLGASGLYAQVAGGKFAPGVYDYPINAPLWSGGASVRHHIAIPGKGTLTQRRRGAWPRPVAPAGTVLTRTLSLPTDVGGRDIKRIETQMMHFNGNVWRGYTYRWRSDQSDADLVPAKGATAEIMNRGRKMKWAFHSRADCMRCHHDPRFLMSFLNDQLIQPNKKQADRFMRLKIASKEYFTGGRLIPMSETKVSLDRRVRSYLHANCTSCHLDGGGGANVRLRVGPSVTRNFMLEKPTRGDFGLEDARIVVPGAPEKSVLFYRLATGGSGRMPPIGPHPSDPFHAVGGDIGAHNRSMLLAIHDWIVAMKPAKPVPVTAQSIPGDLKTPTGALRVFSARLRGDLSDKDWTAAIGLASQSSNAVVSELFEPYLPESKRAKKLGVSFDPKVVLNQTGNPTRGARLFAADGKARCATCHRVGKKGGQLGPDLTQLYARMKREAILKSIVDPAAEVKPDFRLTTLTLKDGRVISGFVQGDQVLSIRTLDGKTLSIPAADVQQKQVAPGSTMPPGLLANLTAQEAADLLAYLISLK